MKEKIQISYDSNTQKQQILEWLLLGLKLTPMQAIQYLGITKAATRVSELLDDGFPIQKRFVKVKNRYGKQVQVMSYYL